MSPLRLTPTHHLFAGGERRPPDALATADGGARFFLPGWLPCGECGQCRRGWVAACPRGRALSGSGPVEAEERFLAPLDEPGVPPLDDEHAACAGVVAELQELSSRVGLGSGDLAIWIGDDARTALGARLSAMRGCPTFHLGAGPGGSGIKALALGDGPRVWNDAVAAAAASAPGGFLERRLFVARAESALVEAALALASPGASLGFLDSAGSATLAPGALSSCRVIVAAGFGYHPDLVPEALATLRRGPALTAGLVAAGSRSEARLTLIAL